MSESHSAEEVRVRVCICVHIPFGLSRSDCQLEEDQQKTEFLRYLICVAATGRFELVFFLVFKMSAGTSDESGYGDCRHLDEGDHVHAGPDDHCSALLVPLAPPWWGCATLYRSQQ